jgi:hypothetical protein
MIMTALAVYAGITTASTAFLAYKLYKNTPQKRDLKLLHDLSLMGRTTIKITRLSPDEHFIRSPKDIL